MSNAIKDLSASVHDRLRNIAKQQNRTFQDTFYLYALERFLYRISKSDLSDQFILKGSLMFMGWGIPLRRPTKDIDIQGTFENSINVLEVIVKTICSQEVEADGLFFDHKSIRGEPINNEAESPGIRIYFNVYLGQATSQLHLDASFSNVINPSVLLVSYPTLLDMPTFEIFGYPYETAIAEKFEAMVKLEIINDRMKDFFDIWILSQQVRIFGNDLLKAIQATFENRKTNFPTSLQTVFTDEFVIQKQYDWIRFLKRSGLDPIKLPSFEEIVIKIREFLGPVIQAGIENQSFDKYWNKEWL